MTTIVRIILLVALFVPPCGANGLWAQTPEVRTKFMSSSTVDSCYAWPADRTVRVVVKGETEKLVGYIGRQGGEVVSRTASIVTALMRVGTLRELAKLPETELIDLGWRKFEPPLQRNSSIEGENDSSVSYAPLPLHVVPPAERRYAVEQSGMEDVANVRYPLQRRYDGEGVLVGIIENGLLDFRHPDFLNADGTSRFVSIWDQSTEGNPPSGYGYGKLWSPEDLNREIRGETRNYREGPEVFHVTAVAGIATGNGNAVGKYCGVAPAARLVHVDMLPSSANLIDALHYIYSVADSLGLPCVVAMAYEVAQDYCDGADPASIAVTEMVSEKPGRIFVAAAGNNSHIRRHYQVTNAAGEKREIWLRCIPSLAYFDPDPVYHHYALLPTDTGKSVRLRFGVALYDDEDRVPVRGEMIPFSARLDISSLLRNGPTLLAVTGGMPADTLYTIMPHLHRRSDSTFGLDLAIRDRTGGMYGKDGLHTLLRIEVEGEGSYEGWNQFFLMDADYLKDRSIFPPDILHADHFNTVNAPANAEGGISVGCFWNRVDFVDVEGRPFRYPPSALRDDDEPPPLPGYLMHTTQTGICRDGRCLPTALAPGNGVPTAIPLAMRGMNDSLFPILDGGLHTVFTGTSSATPVLCGAAALYLQKYPTATAGEFRQALMETSYGDVYTGTVPNERAGYGKIDIFRLLCGEDCEKIEHAGW